MRIAFHPAMDSFRGRPHSEGVADMALTNDESRRLAELADQQVRAVMLRFTKAGCPDGGRGAW